jgi:error-prone DNA polymerase
MKETFCRRRRGLEAPARLHPRLEPVLAPTHGVMLYEEDVMRVTAALTGLSLAEGDDLRRAIGAARTDEEFRSLERGFVAQAARAGVPAGAAHAVWCELTRFASYAFCKAHAAGYGTLGYHAACLKTHFPTEYAVAILNHHAGMYATWVHVEDLRRQGVEFRAPCVQRSAWDTTLETGEPAMARGAVRIGLARVLGLARSTGERIVAGRAARPFRSLADFADHVRPALPELESLILAGALDWTRRTRPSLLLETRAGAKAWTPAREPEPVLAGAGGASLEIEAVAPLAVPELPEFDAAERLRGEVRATGLWFSGHPLDLWVPHEALRGAVPAAELAAHAGRRVAVAGLPCAYRRVETKNGGQMLFITIADRSGLAECVLFPDASRACAHAVRGDVVRIEGRVDDTLGAITLAADRARAIPTRR